MFPNVVTLGQHYNNIEAKTQHGLGTQLGGIGFGIRFRYLGSGSVLVKSRV